MKVQSVGSLKSVFIVSFILTISVALTSYVDSSFVESFTSPKIVGIMFTLASLLSLVYIANTPKILSKYGVLKTLTSVGIVYILSIVGLVTINNYHILQFFFLTYWVSAVAMYLSVDILLSHYSKEGSTGGTRGIYLTVYNLAFLIGPFLAGILVNTIYFKGVYITSGFLVACMLYYFVSKFKDLKIFPKETNFSLISNFLNVLKQKDLRNVYLVAMTLSFFFAWMTIYTPLYLFDQVGLSWQEIGVVFAVMHIPYVLLDIPWGKIADKILGEKEMMMAGIIIVGLCTISLGFITGKEVWIWACGLALTRIGASLIQVTTESYFFKKINKEDTDSISVFRNASPIALLISPIIATIALTFTNRAGLFIILGIIVLCALIPSYKLHDTK